MLLAVLSAAGGLVCYFLAYLFFRHVPFFALGQFDIRVSSGIAALVTWLILGILTFTGYRHWKAGGGLQGYHESAFYHELDPVSGGGVAVDIYAHRVTATAHFLSQIFLAGPLGLLRSGTFFASRIRNEPGLEERLAATLALLRQANKWQPITDYPEHREEILFLAQMGHIDFSTAKGVPRIKAHLLS